MILTRTMTLKADLPLPPMGYSWRLEHDACPQVLLMRDGDPVAPGFLTNLGATNGTEVYADVRGGDSTRHKTEREAALALFAALGIS